MKTDPVKKTVAFFLIHAFLLVGSVYADNAAVSNRTVGQRVAGQNGDGVPDFEMAWGAITNFQIRDPFDPKPVTLKAGIRSSNGVIVLSGNPLKPTAPVCLYLENVYGRPFWSVPVATNNGVKTSLTEKDEYVGWLFLPPEKERFAVEMRTADGSQVPKTKYGISLTPPQLGGKSFGHWDKDGRQGIALLSHEAFELYAFDPAEYFAIEKSGTYKLTLIEHVYMVDSNRLLQAVDLPPVSVNVRVDEAARIR